MEPLQIIEKDVSGVMKQKIMNLVRDTENRAEIISDLRSCVYELDRRDIPAVLSCLSAFQMTKEISPYLISLYEAIICEHAETAILYVRAIMESVVMALRSSPSSELLETCINVVSSLAKDVVNVGSPSSEIVESIISPLLQIWREEVEGSAECLIAVIQTEAWKRVPDEAVAEVCLLATYAIKENSTQFAQNIKIIRLLAQFNELIVHVFMQHLFEASASVIDQEANTANWKRRHAIRMIGSLVEDVKLDTSELAFVISNLEKWSSKGVPSVQTAAFSILRHAKSIQPVNSKRSSFFFSNPIHPETRETTSSKSNSLHTSSKYDSTFINSKGLSQEVADTSETLSPKKNASQARIRKPERYERGDLSPLVWIEESIETTVAGSEANDAQNENAQEESSDDFGKPPVLESDDEYFPAQKGENGEDCKRRDEKECNAESSKDTSGNDKSSTHQSTFRLKYWRKLGKTLAKVGHVTKVGHVAAQSIVNLTFYVAVAIPLIWVAIKLFQSNEGYNTIAPI